MAILFTITVTNRDWDQDLGGWRCPALGIPGAVVDAAYQGGQKIDESWYEVLEEHRIVRWTRETHPQQVTLSINLTEELTTEASTNRWKKLALYCPLLRQC